MVLMNQIWEDVIKIKMNFNMVIYFASINIFSKV